MQSSQNSNQSNSNFLEILQKEMTDDVGGIVWFTKDIHSNLKHVENLDYFFNGSIFSNISNINDNSKHEKLLHVHFSQNFSSSIFFIHFNSFDNFFEILRATLQEFSLEITKKRIILLGNFDNYKEKLEFSFPKTRFDHLNIT